MFRLLPLLTVIWFITLSFAPLALIQQQQTAAPALITQSLIGPPCIGTPTPPRYTVPESARPVHKPKPSQAQIAYVNRWTRNTDKAANILAAVYRVSADTGLPVKLFLAIVQPESGFRPRVISQGGDYGLMQVRVRMHRDRIARLHVTDILSIEQNLRVGADILLEYKRKANGNLYAALVKYNGGSKKMASRILSGLNNIPS